MYYTDFTKKLRESRKIDTIFFVACGGSLGGFYPAYYLLREEAKHLRAEMITSNEFVYATPAACGENSLVILCTMRGTPETCKANEIAQNHGATTIGLYVEPSGLSRKADYAIPYKSIADDEADARFINSTIALEIAFELLAEFENYIHYEEAMDALDRLNDIYHNACASILPAARGFAEEYADTQVLYIMGAGASMGAAYIYSICNIMEMQGIHSSFINHGEFFHGPFEITDRDADFFVLKTVGRTRPMDERVIRFLSGYARRFFVLDAQELGIDLFGGNVKEYFNQALLSPILNNVFLRELAKARNHSYLERKYMWKVDY